MCRKNYMYILEMSKNIWRGINGVKLTKIKELDGTETEKLVGGQLDEKSYISAFRLGTYIATQFKPVVAKAIYDITNDKTVLDTSCGWGDRLAHFFVASDAEEYYGILLMIIQTLIKDISTSNISI